MVTSSPSSEYAPHWDHDFARGKVGENLVESFLVALEGGRIETKTDHRVLETGNVYIETNQETRHGDWVRSGILLTKAEWWSFAGPAGVGFVTISRARLERVCLDHGRRVEKPWTSPDRRGTRGVLVPMREVLRAIFEGTG